MCYSCTWLRESRSGDPAPGDGGGGAEEDPVVGEGDEVGGLGGGGEDPPVAGGGEALGGAALGDAAGDPGVGDDALGVEAVPAGCAGRVAARCVAGEAS